MELGIELRTPLGIYLWSELGIELVIGIGPIGDRDRGWGYVMFGVRVIDDCTITSQVI